MPSAPRVTTMPRRIRESGLLQSAALRSVARLVPAAVKQLGLQSDESSRRSSLAGRLRRGFHHCCWRSRRRSCSASRNAAPEHSATRPVDLLSPRSSFLLQ